MEIDAARPELSSSVSQPLEIHYDHLTPERFAAIIAQHGGMAIRSLFSPAEAQDLVQEVNDLWYLVHNLRHNQLLTENAIEYLIGGHPASLLPNFALLQNLLNKPKFIGALQQFFGDPDLVVYMESTVVRYCDPSISQNFLPWHQDIFTRGERFFTVWVPMCRVGDDAPGLELKPDKLYECLDPSIGGEDVGYGRVGITDELLNRHGGPARFHPVLEVGDVLVFDPYTPHRTYVTQTMSRPRVSLDVRINPLSGNPAPPGSDPTKEQWKTETLRFPARNVVEKVRPGRTLFTFGPLLAAPPPAPAPVAPAAPEPAPAPPSPPAGLTRRLTRRLKEFVGG